MDPRQKSNYLIAAIFFILTLVCVAILLSNSPQPPAADISTPPGAAVEPEAAPPAAATEGTAPTGRTEEQMRRVTPVVNAVSPATAAGLNRSARVLDEAADRQTKAAEEILGKGE